MSAVKVFFAPFVAVRSSASGFGPINLTVGGEAAGPPAHALVAVVSMLAVSNSMTNAVILPMPSNDSV